MLKCSSVPGLSSLGQANTILVVPWRLGKAARSEQPEMQKKPAAVIATRKRPSITPRLTLSALKIGVAITSRMSHDEERLNGFRTRNKPERAPPHWLDPLVSSSRREKTKNTVSPTEASESPRRSPATGARKGKKNPCRPHS
jgi:hypothetical protein